MGKFAIGMVLMVAVPKLSRRAKLPDVVGLLLAGVLFGLSRIGVRLLKKMEDEENRYFVFLLLILAVTLVRRFSGFGAISL